MRRGSWNGQPFGWDSGWHGRNVKDLSNRLHNVHRERRGSIDASPKNSKKNKKKLTPMLIEPTFSSPPHQRTFARTNTMKKSNIKLRPGSAHSSRRRGINRPQLPQHGGTNSQIFATSAAATSTTTSAATLNPINSRVEISPTESSSSSSSGGGRERRARPATASKSRSSSSKSKRSNRTTMPISAWHGSSGTSINAAYSDFVRMMALFYDQTDYENIAKKACEDAARLQEKMTLRAEYTGC